MADSSVKRPKGIPDVSVRDGISYRGLNQTYGAKTSSCFVRVNIPLFVQVGVSCIQHLMWRRKDLSRDGCTFRLVTI